MLTHIIEFESPKSVYDPAPWPVGIDQDRDAISGLGPDERNARLVGFGPAGEQDITVFVDEAVQHPEKVVGMTPTFSDGNLFVWNIPVREFRAIEQVK